MGIGETGVVAGYSFVGARSYAAVLWDSGVVPSSDVLWFLPKWKT